jgi:hypothetical protein
MNRPQASRHSSSSQKQTSICLARNRFIGRPFLPRARSFTLAAGFWLAGSLSLSAVLVLHAAAAALPLPVSLSFSPHPPVIHSLVPLAHLQHSPTHYHGKLSSPVFTPSFPLSPNRDNNNHHLNARHPTPPLARAALCRPPDSLAAFHPSPDRLHQTRAARDTVKPNSSPSRS